MQAENQRITAKYHRLKARYEELLNQQNVSNVEIIPTIEASKEMCDQSSQTVTTEVETTKPAAKVLHAHSLLLKKYEKELEKTAINMETIASQKVANTKLEGQLKQALEKGQSSKLALSKLQKKHENTTTKMKSQLEVAVAERDEIRTHLGKIKSEMAFINQNFFDEIEDLKYALQESAKLNAVYSKTLKGLCKENKLDYKQVLQSMASKYRGKR